MGFVNPLKDPPSSVNTCVCRYDVTTVQSGIRIAVLASYNLDSVIIVNQHKAI